MRDSACLRSPRCFGISTGVTVSTPLIAGTRHIPTYRRERNLFVLPSLRGFEKLPIGCRIAWLPTCGPIYLF